MRRPLLLQFLPNTIELTYIALTTVVVILLGNAKLLLERAGMLSSADLIGQQFSTKATAGLDSLNSFRFTGTVTTSIVWGGVGLVVYSMLQAIRRAIRTAAYQRELGSQEYVHPKQFNYASYWHQILIDTILGFLFLSLLALGVLLYIIVALPASFAYAQRFILKPHVSNTLDPIYSILITFIATTLLFLIVRLVIRHHRAASIEA